MITLDAIRGLMVGALVRLMDYEISNGGIQAAEIHWASLNSVVEELSIEAGLDLPHFLIDFPEVATVGIRLMTFRSHLREYEASAI